MTIQEAVGSGKLFRRPGWQFWMSCTKGGGVILVDGTYRPAEFIKRDILATDWEIKNGEEESK